MALHQDIKHIWCDLCNPSEPKKSTFKMHLNHSKKNARVLEKKCLATTMRLLY